jgi:hypothetical protein
MKDLIARIACTVDTEECFNGECNHCSMENLMESMEEGEQQVRSSTYERRD